MSPLVYPLDGTSLALALNADEREILRRLISEMRTLLAAEIPDVDPVRARLFPRAYHEDDDETKYREMTEGELEQSKRAALDSVAETLGDESGDLEVALLPDQVQAWLTLLTDLRLSIGTRLDVTEEKMAEPLAQGDPEAPAYEVLHWLGWTQELMLRYLDPEKQRTEEV